MALVSRERTPCSVCGRVLGFDEEIVAFEPFLRADHRLGRYSDSAMHARCYAAWPESAEFDRLRAEAAEAGRALYTPERMKEMMRRGVEEREARARRDSAYNAEHARIVASVRDRAPACPHCGVRSTSFRELTRAARHRLACPSCARSFGAEDLISA